MQDQIHGLIYPSTACSSSVGADTLYTPALDCPLLEGMWVLLHVAVAAVCCCPPHPHAQGGLAPALYGEYSLGPARIQSMQDSYYTLLGTGVECIIQYTV